jgi:hypothetical protein
VLRRKNVSVYLYQLLLKWARLLNENRGPGVGESWAVVLKYCKVNIDLQKL